MEAASNACREKEVGSHGSRKIVANLPIEENHDAEEFPYLHSAIQRCSMCKRKRMVENLISEKIIGCAIQVHRGLGPGLLESAYAECLKYELKKTELLVER
jgi:hypothetical protein